MRACVCARVHVSRCVCARSLVIIKLSQPSGREEEGRVFWRNSIAFRGGRAIPSLAAEGRERGGGKVKRGRDLSVFISRGI